MGNVLIFISLLISVLWMRYRKRSLDMATGLVVGNIFFALVPMVMTNMIGEIVAEGLPIRPFSHASLSLGFYVFLFSVALILADEWSRLIQVNWGRSATTFRPQPDPTFSEFRIAFVLATISLVIVFFNSGKLSGAHWAAHPETGFIGAVTSVLALSLRAYLFAIAIKTLRQRRAQTMLIMIVFAVLDIILTGNRISALYLVFAVLFSRAFSYQAILLGAVPGLPAGFLLAVLYPAFRGVVWNTFGGFSGFLVAFEYVWRNGLPTAFYLSNIYTMFEAANVVIFQYIFETFGRHHAFLDGQTVIVKPLTFFIPREIFPDKPLGLGTRLGTDIFGFDGLSLNSLLMGEFYANFGWFAPLFLFGVIGLVVTLLRCVRTFQDKHYQLALFLIAFSSWRHEFNYIFFSFIMLVLSINLVKLLARMRIRASDTT